MNGRQGELAGVPVAEAKLPALRSRLAGSRLFWGAFGIIAFLIFWQVAGSRIDPLFFAPPLDILRAVPDVFRQGLIPAYLNTLAVYLIGVTAAIVLGYVIGVAWGIFRVFKEFFDPLVVLLYCTPTIVLIPTLVIWFGNGWAPVLFLIFVASFFPVLFSVQFGVTQISQDLAEVARIFGATRREYISKIIIPATLPYAFSGIRISLPRGFIAALAAEMLISGDGMGGMVIYFGDAFQTDRYFVPVVLVAATALAISQAMDLLEARLVRWRDRI